MAKLRIYSQRNLDDIPQLHRLPAEQRFEMRVVSSILPFRVNQYVIDNLIDWERVPDDPMFIQSFPQKEMLEESMFLQMADLLRSDPPNAEVQRLAARLRMQLNPHPGGQRELNVPVISGVRLEELQHKYEQTVLFFPGQGQTCHSYCTYCFRWPQFVGDKSWRFAANDAMNLVRFLKAHREVTDVIITGGDPMVMSSRLLLRYLEVLSSDELESVRTIRIGTKALSYWPQRFTTDPDADDLLRAFEALTVGGKHIALMAHISHWIELEPAPALEAIRRLRSTGATIRTQAPLLRRVNDSSEVWARMWQREVELGMQPYYMFIERDTGAHRYFKVPLIEAIGIYANAVERVSGLARTARGPVMSAAPGKVELLGMSEIGGEQMFVLRFIQARRRAWLNRPFFGKLDRNATWLSDLEPAFGEKEFFYEAEFRRIVQAAGARAPSETPPVFEDPSKIDGLAASGSR